MVRKTHHSGFVAIALLLIFIPLVIFQTYLQKLIFIQTRAIRLHSENLTNKNKLNQETINYLNKLNTKIERSPLSGNRGVFTILNLERSRILLNLVYQNTSVNQINWEHFVNFPFYENFQNSNVYPILMKEDVVVKSNLLFNFDESAFKNNITIKQSSNSLGLVFLGSVNISELKILASDNQSISSHTFIVAEGQIEILKPLILETKVETENSLYLVSNSGEILIQNNAALRGCNCSADAKNSCLIINRSLFSSNLSGKFLQYEEKCILPNWPAVHEKNEIIGKMLKGS